MPRSHFIIITELMPIFQAIAALKRFVPLGDTKRTPAEGVSSFWGPLRLAHALITAASELGIRLLS